jgi:hypothetical protein
MNTVFCLWCRDHVDTDRIRGRRREEEVPTTMVDLADGWPYAEPTGQCGVIQVGWRGQNLANGEVADRNAYLVALPVVIEADSDDEVGERAERVRAWLLRQVGHQHGEGGEEAPALSEPTYRWYLTR